MKTKREQEIKVTRELLNKVVGSLFVLNPKLEIIQIIGTSRRIKKNAKSNLSSGYIFYRDESQKVKHG
jgi:hypothetical protein